MKTYAFKMHRARPIELATITRANVQWIRQTYADELTDFGPFTGDPQYLLHWGPVEVGGSRRVWNWPVEQLAVDSTMRSYSDALTERRQMLSFWTPEARAAAKGEGPEPPAGGRVMKWDGHSLLFLEGPWRERREHQLSFDEVDALLERTGKKFRSAVLPPDGPKLPFVGFL